MEKSTVLKIIEDHYLKKDGQDITYELGLGPLFDDLSNKEKVTPKYYYFKFDRSENGTSPLSEDESIMAWAMKAQTSLGENIEDRIGRTAKLIGKFIKKHRNTKLILLWDDCDAGTSLDKIIGIKKFFKFLIENGKKDNVEITIIVTANAYEMARDLNCIDVSNFKMVKFKDYEDYKAFVLSSYKFRVNDMKQAYEKYKKEKEKK